MRNKILVIVLAVLLVVSGVVHLIGFRQVRRANNTLDSQRLRNESLLSEKLSIEKLTDKLRQDMQSITDANARAKTELELMSETIHLKDTQLGKVIADKKRMRATHERLQRHIDSLARQIDVIESEAAVEKKMLEDSIKYLIEFSESLSAELNGHVNQ